MKCISAVAFLFVGIVYLSVHFKIAITVSKDNLDFMAISWKTDNQTDDFIFS